MEPKPAPSIDKPTFGKVIDWRLVVKLEKTFGDFDPGVFFRFDTIMKKFKIVN